MTLLEYIYQNGFVGMPFFEIALLECFYWNELVGLDLLNEFIGMNLLGWICWNGFLGMNLME